ncbi:hydroxyacylglutathione hydrolase [Enterovibrio nigricans]|uniref:Hydroxyacylglutathione hydrolase n=1 Tax=Enterovibrio nigricans DSM 22720 TaxID=1121868 RepID=A0A1T4UNI0_9GAMM|nr:hydroxyacylglutathione hydrolase [Enterovibrio nigricans]PKF50607.1 hydroxyacylglutathione hydrolase [Enterovibrio nigricans]SKA54138.1 hydroxyacylglutathione hydrolase [Enterovibrio nigricans DSM 22720]
MLSVSSIPAFNDNYIWLLKNDDNHCVVVDPGDATPVIKTLTEQGLTLDAIFITHHHNDHIGGVDKLRSLFPTIAVYGPNTVRFAQVTHPVANNDTFTLFGENFTVFQVPGHTLDHIAYYAEGMLFCGDTLFSGGCGRLFEGTAAQMHHSLTVLSSLPEATNVYCAHEYTQSNLNFALAVEPNNDALARYAYDVKALREKSQSTLPTTIAVEKDINPFLRAHVDTVKAAVTNHAEGVSDVEIFAALRRWKDDF